jgi:general secretion pathway protein A
MMDLRAQFGFTQLPFTREIRVADRFHLQLFDEALEALLHTVDQRMSAAVIAPAGTGKTALLRAVRAGLPEARYRVHYVKASNLSRKDMGREIATAVGVDAAGNFATLLRRLQERFLETSDNDGVRPVLLVDDAHDLRREVLGLVRVLTNFDMDSRLVVSVVLAGQPLLAQNLQRPELEDVARRLAHCATLRSLSRDETVKYLEHRCTVAGARASPFDGGSIDAIYELGRSNLRATDALALKSLELCCRASARVVDANHVVEARKLLWP